MRRAAAARAATRPPPGAFAAYGIISNINAGVLITIAWIGVVKQTGLTPLDAGMWPRFLGLYAGTRRCALAERARSSVRRCKCSQHDCAWLQQQLAQDGTRHQAERPTAARASSRRCFR